MQAELDQALARNDLDAARALSAAMSAVEPHNAELWRVRALVEVHLGRPEQALEFLQQAVNLRPQSPDLRSEFASLLQWLGDLPQAQTQLHEAIRLQPGEVRHKLKLAAILLSCGKASEAAMLARHIVSRQPNVHAGWHVLADCAFHSADWQAALRSFQRAIELCPPDQRGELATLWYYVGRCAQKLMRPEHALRAFDQALHLDSKLYTARAQRVFTQRTLAHWQDLSQQAAHLLRLAKLGVPGISPAGFLAEFSDALTQSQVARTEAKLIARQLSLPAFDAEALAKQRRKIAQSLTARSGPLRAGFVSHGFGMHPIGWSTVECFEQMDRSRVHIVLFCTLPADRSSVYKRLAHASAHVCDLSGLAPAQAAQKVRELGIEVLVDLAGFGDGGMPSLFALRPAPVQVQWLAHPGTSGAPWMDYLIADAQVLPPAMRASFSEAIVYLPGSFQPTNAHFPATPTQARSAYGLPESAVVLVNFNDNYTINPEVFALWMHILLVCPKAVLWLLKRPNGALFAQNLVAQAGAAGVASERLIFLPEGSLSEQLAALQQADLYLDTFPHSALDGARDALSVGTPVLALAGETFVGRLSCSLNAAVHMQALNALDVSAYLDAAIALTQSPDALTQWREHLKAHRQLLFDSQRFADHLTLALEQMFARARLGLDPEDISLG